MKWSRVCVCGGERSIPGATWRGQKIFFNFKNEKKEIDFGQKCNENTSTTFDRWLSLYQLINWHFGIKERSLCILYLPKNRIYGS